MKMLLSATGKEKVCRSLIQKNGTDDFRMEEILTKIENDALVTSQEDFFKEYRRVRIWVFVYVAVCRRMGLWPFGLIKSNKQALK